MKVSGVSVWIIGRVSLIWDQSHSSKAANLERSAVVMIISDVHSTSVYKIGLPPLPEILALLGTYCSKLLGSIVPCSPRPSPHPYYWWIERYKNELSTHSENLASCLHSEWVCKHLSLLFCSGRCECSCMTYTWSLFSLFITSPSTSLISLSHFSLHLFWLLGSLPHFFLFPLPLYTLSLYTLSPSPSPLSSSSWSGGQHHSELRKSQLEENTTNLGGTRRQ